MRVLVDTNILLDVILLREPHLENSKRVLQCCQSFVDGYMALHSFSNMFYILHEIENFSVEECRNTLNKFLYVFDVAGLTKAQLVSAINDVNFDDLEDSMQHGSALSADVDYIITRDTDDFKNCAVPAITPEQFLLIAHENWEE